MKKSLFIYDKSYYYCNYTEYLPQHIIYCEVLGLSAERLFTNKISTMDIYMDLNGNLKRFYEYLENDEKRIKFKKQLKSNNIDVEDKELKEVLSYYNKCVEKIKKQHKEKYVEFYSKRNDRYIDKNSFDFSKSFGVNKMDLMLIVDRLNEIQVHEYVEAKEVFPQITEFIKLFDDEETLFALDIQQAKEYYNINEVELMKHLLSTDPKGILQIICNDEQLRGILEVLKSEKYYKKNILSNSISKKNSEFIVGDKVTFFEKSPQGYRINQREGTLTRRGNEIATIIGEYGDEHEVPYNAVIRRKKYTKEAAIESPINWYGGKYYLAKEIINIFPEGCNNYVEVFGGAAHILFRKELANTKNVYNDINRGLYTFFNLLSDASKRNKLMNKLTLTPYHQSVWNDSEYWEDEEDEVELARRFYIRTMQARSSNGGWSYTLNKKWTRRNMAASVSKWLGNIENNIHRSIDKLSKIIVENNSFEECIREHDSRDTLFYLDPPYVPDTRTMKKGYQYELTVEQHKRLVDILLNVKGRVVLSGYENDIYTRLEKEGGFTRILVKKVMKSSVNVNREDNTGEEYVWINFKLEDIKLIKYVLRELLESTEEKEPINKKNISLLELQCNYIFKEDYLKFLRWYTNGNFKREVIESINNNGELAINKLYGYDSEEDDKKIRKLNDKYIIIGETINEDKILINTEDDKLYFENNNMYIKKADSFSKLIIDCFDAYSKSRLN